MQLTRDSDYALRIVMVMAELAAKDVFDFPEVSLRKIALKTSVPRNIAKRLCSSLCDAGILVPGKSALTYRAGRNIFRVSLYDILSAVEGSCGLFAVFDMDCGLYEGCFGSFSEIDRNIEEILRAADIAKLMQSQK